MKFPESTIADCIRWLLSIPPDANRHNYLLALARKILDSGCDPEQTLLYIASALENAERPFPAREIQSAIESAVRDFVQANGKPALRPSRRPKPMPVDQNAVQRALYYEQDLAWWKARSKPPPTTMEGVLAGLGFLPGEFVCIGKHPKNATTLTREAWSRAPLHIFSQIVPNPMKGPHGLSKVGKPSARCDDNVSFRRMLVVEIDTGISLDHQAKIIGHLGESICQSPQMIAWSGNKSLHAFFDVSQWPENMREHWFRVATSLGADSRLWIPCQYCRLPGGVNPITGKEQTILYSQL